MDPGHMKEPLLCVGLIERASVVRGVLHGRFKSGDAILDPGPFECTAGTTGVRCTSASAAVEARELVLTPVDGAPFTLSDIVIGVQFHWQRAEPQTFRGALRVKRRGDGSLVPVNEVGLEEYLESVISSEMSASSPIELLRAHAITSRSWLVAMLEREKSGGGPTGSTTTGPGGREIVRWYTREDHDLFDVCADDHCQRYQGITRVVSPAVHAAVADTRGVFLVYDGHVCDARFYKACGGITEEFQNSWEEVRVPYLGSISDSPHPFPALASEPDVAAWVRGSPAAYCNTRDLRHHPPGPSVVRPGDARLLPLDGVIRAVRTGGYPCGAIGDRFWAAEGAYPRPPGAVRSAVLAACRRKQGDGDGGQGAGDPQVAVALAPVQRRVRC